MVTLTPRAHAGLALALVLAACVPPLEAKDDTVASSSAATGGGAGGATGAGGSGAGGGGEPFVVPPEVASWLATSKGGFCNTAKNSYVNLCGDVAYCNDANLLRTFPSGVSVDVGFHWGGQNGGSLVELGADAPTDPKIAIELRVDGTIFARGPQHRPGLVFLVPLGPHVVSYRVGADRRALFVDGVRVAEEAKAYGKPFLSPGPDGDPGAVLGHATTKQTTGGTAARWLRFAPFLFHLRSGVDSFEALSLLEVLKRDAARTVRLFHGAEAGASDWPEKDTNFPKLAVAKGSVWVEDVDGSCF